MGSGIKMPTSMGKSYLHGSDKRAGKVSLIVMSILIPVMILSALMMAVLRGNNDATQVQGQMNVGNVPNININYTQYKAIIQQELDAAKHGISVAEQQQIQMIQEGFLDGYFGLLDGNVDGEQLMEYITNNLDILMTLANIGDSAGGVATRVSVRNYGFLGLGLRFYFSRSEAVKLANMCYSFALISTIVSLFPILAPVALPFAAVMGILGSLISNNITDRGLEMDFYALVFCGVRGR